MVIMKGVNNSMKKIIFTICLIIVMIFPMCGIAETPSHTLKTPIVKLEGTAQDFCVDEETRAMVAVGLLVSYGQQKEMESMSFKLDSTYIGYNGDCVYVVLSLTESERIIFEFDTAYSFCLYHIENTTDTNQNEQVCKELCPEYNWKIDERALLGAFSQITK